jgi:energy-converting hydrogenase Eha subunit G
MRPPGVAFGLLVRIAFDYTLCAAVSWPPTACRWYLIARLAKRMASDTFGILGLGGVVWAVHFQNFKEIHFLKAGLNWCFIANVAGLQVLLSKMEKFLSFESEVSVVALAWCG